MTDYHFVAWHNPNFLQFDCFLLFNLSERFDKHTARIDKNFPRCNTISSKLFLRLAIEYRCNNFKRSEYED